MTPQQPPAASLIEALSETARLLIDIAHEITDGTYNAAKAEQDRHALIAADLPGTLATWAQAHA